MAPLGLTGLLMEPDVRVFMETEPRVLGRPVVRRKILSMSFVPAPRLGSLGVG